ncbi:MAG: TniB family NTP-binding protein [Sulfurimonas sp.]|uniref:TniB family NTP-binding protein n=1 Tax=Sulfurimonas sp. TaxID=2022749 RepID=UPI0025F0FDB1|nr:TniB family NTP-binding protein [Sulfurimonas sp.]MCK9490711.1 TniB family NTP-binding protein [Sulfurimonas sp.]
MTSLYEHLNEDCKRLIHSNKEDKIQFMHESVWIEYPKTKEILRLLKQLMDRPKKPRMPNLLIIGESNIGKTSIVTEFEKLHQGYTIEDENEMSVVIRPVLLALAPTKADEKSLYISILESFWTPFRTTDSLAKLRNQVYYLMRECNVKILVLDEMHHFLSGTPVQQRDVMNALKNIGTKLMIPIVGVGIKDAALILTSDPQLSSRFDLIKLSKWELDKNFRGLLKAFEKRLPLKNASNLDERDKATLLHSISQGNLGDLHRLLIECATFCIENNKEEITLDIIGKYKWLKPTSNLTPREIQL